MSNFWTETRHNKIAVLTFTRPPKNWMSLQAMTELTEHLERLSKLSDEVTLVMLTGGLDEYFVAHADLDDLKALGKGEAVEGDPRSWYLALTLLETMPQPTVAAIDGQAWGGGCEIALACTLRLGSERAHLGQMEVKLGIIPGAGGTQRLPRLVGNALGAELCLSGRIVKAEEAKQIGLLNAVLPTEGFVDAAVQWCESISQNPAHAVFAVKQALYESRDLRFKEGLKVEARLFAETNRSEKARNLNNNVERS